MAVDLRQVTDAYPAYRAQWGIEEFLFGAQGNDIEHSRKADKIDGSGFGTRVRNNLPGLQDGSLKIKGLAAMEKGALNWQINKWFGRVSPVNAWYALQGLEALQPITLQPSSIIDASISAKLKDAVDFSLELDARGAYDDGVILLSPGTVLTGATGTSSVDDNTNEGGATTTGCAAHLHVWAFDGGTSPSVTVTLEQSSDGTVWTDLLEFDVFDQLGSQRITLPSTTTVQARVRASWTVTGSPDDVQVLCAFARGIDLDV